MAAEFHQILVYVVALAQIAQSSSGGVAIRHALPVLRMTSCFHAVDSAVRRKPGLENPEDFVKFY